MPRTEAFEAYSKEYDTWFETHPKLCEALKMMSEPISKRGLKKGYFS